VKLVRRKTNTRLYDKHGNLVAAEVARRAQKYFLEHPTLLKPVDPADLEQGSETPNQGKKDHYPIKNPYFEDKQSYNIQRCIDDSIKPIFGYPLPLFYQKKDDELRPEFDVDMLMPNVVGYLR
jgi:hypothetical protein